MQFSIFLPPGAAGDQLTHASNSNVAESTSGSSTNSTTATSVPVIYYLAGLTCNEELMLIKSGAERIAASRGVAIVCPDTSPRHVDIDGSEDSWDFGSGAGFYVDASESPWSTNYRMASYVTKELPMILREHFPILDSVKQSIMGHSMGGHGALVLALKNASMYQSVSAFAPICHPSQCSWGIKAFTGYLGVDETQWEAYDATLLMKQLGPIPDLPILIDQGTDDQFLHEQQLLPQAFEEACRLKNQANFRLRMQDDYDHSYYFISTFMEEHLHFHADRLFSSKGTDE